MEQYSTFSHAVCHHSVFKASIAAPLRLRGRSKFRSFFRPTYNTSPRLLKHSRIQIFLQPHPSSLKLASYTSDLPTMRRDRKKAASTTIMPVAGFARPDEIMNGVNEVGLK